MTAMHLSWVRQALQVPEELAPEAQIETLKAKPPGLLFWEFICIFC